MCASTLPLLTIGFIIVIGEIDVRGGTSLRRIQKRRRFLFEIREARGVKAHRRKRSICGRKNESRLGCSCACAFEINGGSILFGNIHAYTRSERVRVVKVFEI